jgi:hypothetical protein
MSVRFCYVMLRSGEFCWVQSVELRCVEIISVLLILVLLGSVSCVTSRCDMLSWIELRFVSFAMLGSDRLNYVKFYYVILGER